jgi:hypothetical protein
MFLVFVTLAALTASDAPAVSANDVSCLSAHTEHVMRPAGYRTERITVFNHCQDTVRAKVKVSSAVDSNCEQFDFGAFTWETGSGLGNPHSRGLSRATSWVVPPLGG